MPPVPLGFTHLYPRTSTCLLMSLRCNCCGPFAWMAPFLWTSMTAFLKNQPKTKPQKASHLPVARTAPFPAPESLTEGNISRVPFCSLYPPTMSGSAQPCLPSFPFPLLLIPPHSHFTLVHSPQHTKTGCPGPPIMFRKDYGGWFPSNHNSCPRRNYIPSIQNSVIPFPSCGELGNKAIFRSLGTFFSL